MRLPLPARFARPASRVLVALCVVACTGADPAVTSTAPPAATAPASVLSVSEAVQLALARNPDIITARKQRGIAAAGVITARTYPFNPIATTYVWYDNGPASAFVTNHVFNEDIVRLDLEVRGQGGFRRSAACAAMSRTEWEIATQEVALSVRVIRACDALAYRREKLLLVDEGAKLLQQSTDQLSKLVEQGKASRADLLLARADVADIRTARTPAYTQFVTAWYDLRRLLGMVDEPLEDVRDTLASAMRPEATNLDTVALERRPDLRALELAVQEANARLRLEVANRYGNPSVGPAFEYNETSVFFVGVALNYPLPFLNTHKGEIAMRLAERDKALAAAQAGEVHIRQDVQAALARLQNAADVVTAYRTKTLPTLEEARRDIDRLFAQGEPGVDVTRTTAVRQRLLKARDLYLDSLFELSQARADLAAAIGDPSLAIIEASSPKEALPPPKKKDGP